jgi:hypothetical protein
VLAWFSPLIAAVFLFFGGLLGATLWLALVALFALGGWGAFWLFVWWAVVPIAAAGVCHIAHQSEASASL